MAGDELNDPLGVERPSKSGSPRRRTAVVLSCIGLAAVTGAGLFLAMGNPHGGEPFAVAALPPPKPIGAPITEDRQPTGSIRAPAQADGSSATENGVTVFRANTRPADSSKGPLVIKVPEALGQSEVLPVDKRLVEMTRYGPLPKIGADGTRPADFYARPLVFAGTIRPGAPRIAILIGGLGLNQAATNQAIDRMPAAVTLGFAPYGDHLDAIVQRAKMSGHEVLLQIPMEAFGYQDSQPGPHTLHTSAATETTIDDLHWLMSRMTGYAGVTNFLGGKFTADKTAMTNVLQEIGGRGLFYVDDGTSKRSLGPALAPALGVAAARADVVLDASSDQATLRAALVKLEAVARDKGTAIGMASGLPGNLDAIEAFASTLEAKGIALVPISALTSTSTPAMAAAP